MPQRPSFLPWCATARGFAVLTCIAATLATPLAHAQAAASERDVPAKKLPVPATVSPQMQTLIAAPLTPTWNVIPNTADEWKQQVNEGAAARCAACRPCVRHSR